MTKLRDRDGKFVDVLLPVASGPYTYALPPGLPEAAPGARVEVPFRNRVASGVVTGRPDQVPPEIRSRIREVLAVEEGPPFLPPPYLRFLHWVAAYYMSPPGAVLKYAVPPGVWKGTRPARPAPELPEAASADCFISTTKRCPVTRPASTRWLLA